MNRTSSLFRALVAVFVVTGVLTAGFMIVRVQALSITTLGVPITQNFDTLATTGTTNPWTDDTTLPGWYSQFKLQTGNPTVYIANSGGTNTGAIYSFGVAGTNPITDRALGSASSGTPGTIFTALKLTNNTGSTITSLDISFVGEQWRNGGNANTQPLAFQYQVANTGTITDANTPTTGWTAFSSLDFISPTVGATAAALDGNAAANRTTKSANLAVTINVGQEVWLRWVDINDAGNDHGLSIDDLSVTANASQVIPTLNINDVTQAETNAGTTTFTFTVSLTAPAPAGGVSFDIVTADGTAQDDNPAAEDNDYVAKNEPDRTISAGNSTATFTVTVNGDTTPETNETFFVNVTNITGATPGDTQGVGTISNDDVTLTSIYAIQGSGTMSPLNGNAVTTSGVVTGRRSNGFFLQDPTGDANTATSDGIFVFTSAAPPTGAAIGNNVQVSGTVSEFIPPSDPVQKPMTELSGAIAVTVLSTGNPLPAPTTIAAADTQVNNLENLERFEGMRVVVPSMTVCGPTGGSINEPNATVSSNGVFFGVVSGVPRPFREPGILRSDPLPAGAPATVPRFDENPERIRVDSNAQPGTTILNVAAGTVITNLTGELDYSFRTWSILPEAANPPTVGTQPGSVPVPTPVADEFTVVSFNMERFFDTFNDPTTGDPVLTAAAFNRRLAKASLIVRTVQRYPDVIGVQEMENLSTLQAVASQINTDAVNIDALPNPNYTAYLSEGNDPGGIDVGFVVKQSRISVVDVTQFGLTNTFTNPDSLTSTLNDRPPLLLRATCPRPLGGTVAFTVIVNHLRSLNGVDDPGPGSNGFATEGERVRFKRRAQAEYLANLIQSRQTSDPNELIITVGDMNAFAVNDGLVDSIGTIKGTPAPASQVTLASSDLVNPDLINLVDTLPPTQQYSYNFDGNAQTLDHIIVNQKALSFLTRFAYARNDSDFAVKNYESTNELRISDHDQPVAYFNLGAIGAGGVLQFSSGNYGVTESAGFRTITVERSGDTSRAATVDYTSSDHSTPADFLPCTSPGAGFASSRCDFTTAAGTLRFAAGETSKTFNLLINQDNYVEGPETLSVTLSNPTGGAVLGVTQTATVGITDDAMEPPTNPIDSSSDFVRSQYHDFLNREPDAPGLAFWTDNIDKCNDPARRPAGQTVAQCIDKQRESTAIAFFMSPEFQMTGGFVYHLYKGSLTGAPNYDAGSPNSSAGRFPTFLEFLHDMSQVSEGIVVNNQISGAVVEANRNTLAAAFVARPEFVAKYGGLNNTLYVQELFNTTGIAATAAEKQALVDGLTGGTESRASVLRKVVDGTVVIGESNVQFTTTYGQAFINQENRRLFVYLEYVAYLRRNPDTAGFVFWLGKLNFYNGDPFQAEMVRSFILSPEYRNRFGQP